MSTTRLVSADSIILDRQPVDGGLLYCKTKAGRLAISSTVVEDSIGSDNVSLSVNGTSLDLVDLGGNNTVSEDVSNIYGAVSLVDMQDASDIASEVNDNVLTFDIAFNRWINTNIPRDMFALTDVTVSSPPLNSVLVYNAGTWTAQLLPETTTGEHGYIITDDNGNTVGTNDNVSNTQVDSVAVGEFSECGAASTVSIGYSASTRGTGSISVGASSRSGGDGNVLLGYNNRLTNPSITNKFVLGTNVTAALPSNSFQTDTGLLSSALLRDNLQALWDGNELGSGFKIPYAQTSSATVTAIVGTTTSISSATILWRALQATATSWVVDFTGNFTFTPSGSAPWQFRVRINFYDSFDFTTASQVRGVVHINNIFNEGMRNLITSMEAQTSSKNVLINVSYTDVGTQVRRVEFSGQFVIV